MPYSWFSIVFVFGASKVVDARCHHAELLPLCSSLVGVEVYAINKLAPRIKKRPPDLSCTPLNILWKFIVPSHPGRIYNWMTFFFKKIAYVKFLAFHNLLLSVDSAVTFSWQAISDRVSRAKTRRHDRLVLQCPAFTRLIAPLDGILVHRLRIQSCNVTRSEVMLSNKHYMLCLQCKLSIKLVTRPC